jgi:hypothetical protein
MEQIAEDWEIVSCEINYTWKRTLVMQLLVGLLTLGWSGPDSVYFSSGATWTVRQKSTGSLRRVTASNRSEAADNINKGLFDPD